MLDRLPVGERNVVSLGGWMGCADFCRECSSSRTSRSRQCSILLVCFRRCYSLGVCSAARTAVSGLVGEAVWALVGRAGETHHIARAAEDKDEGG